MGYNKADRPRKRTGGGGYGYFKNINAPIGGQKQVERAKVFRHPKSKTERQFTR